MLRDQTRNALVRENGKGFLALPTDRGPHKDTHRVARSQSLSVNCVGILSVPAPIGRCWPARPDLGERWPSRLVATAEEDRLSFRPPFCVSYRMERAIFFALAGR